MGRKNKQKRSRPDFETQLLNELIDMHGRLLVWHPVINGRVLGKVDIVEVMEYASLFDLHAIPYKNHLYIGPLWKGKPPSPEAQPVEDSTVSDS